jgi:hypothetical protein
MPEDAPVTSAVLDGAGGGSWVVLKFIDNDTSLLTDGYR